MKETGEPEFRLLEPLGKAEEPYSHVYRAEHATLGVCVAKFVNLVVRAAEGRDAREEARLMQLCSHPSVCQVLAVSWVRDEDLCRQDLAERPDLQGHPLVLQFFHRAEDRSHLVLFLPEYPGGSLTRRLQSGRLSLTVRLNLLFQVLEALAIVHSRGVLHLDLKPGNVFLDGEDNLVLGDFGQSVALDPGGAADAPAYGYIACMPPEYYSSGRRLSLPSDVYVAGSFAYRLLNGEAFWEQALAREGGELELAIRKGRFPDRSEYHSEVSPALRQVIGQALSPDPMERPASAGEFLQRMRTAAGNIQACD